MMPRGPGRPREFDIDAALEAALLVFRERGYHAASLTELGSAMRLTGGSIYKAFGDKRSIFLAAFDRYTSQRHKKLADLLDAEKSGRDKLRALLRFSADSSHGIEGRRGCLVVGSATDLTLLDDDMAAHVAKALKRLETLLRNLIEIGHSDGSVPPRVDVDASTCALLCLLQGLRVVGKLGRTRSEMMAAAEQALELLT
jgi:TetR/AcrR family transcriptional regulator, transcriptional repressor for nem operon